MEDNKLLSKSFLWMCIGLLVTFVTGFGVSMNERMLENIFAGSSFWILIVLELILVIVLSARVMKMSPTAAKICFILYAFVSGLTSKLRTTVQNHLYGSDKPHPSTVRNFLPRSLRYGRRSSLMLW